MNFAFLDGLPRVSAKAEAVGGGVAEKVEVRGGARGDAVGLGEDANEVEEKWGRWPEDLAGASKGTSGICANRS